MKPTTRYAKSLPRTALAGLGLVLVCWALNWGLDGLRTHWLFFPQWFGYFLVVDGLARGLTGTSPLTRGVRHVAVLFLLSIPVWWLFEGLNVFTQNWIYLGREQFTDLEYFLFASLSFSTVIPAVFATAEVLMGTTFVQRLKGFSFPTVRGLYWRLHVLGWVMLVLMVIAPHLFFPFLWLSVFFIVDPLNAMRGRPSLFRDALDGDFRRLVAYGMGALVCGFFWELWNIYSFPKWIYDIPYLEVLHVFEMPLAGYGGYIPFGWELFALYHLVTGFGRRG